MSIHLNKPYKIIHYKHKRYDAHYKIHSEESLVVPMRSYGDEVLCDVRWENERGELKVLHEAMFTSEYLLPISPLVDEKLFELWTHYYARTELS
jgi:hypothetical protein